MKWTKRDFELGAERLRRECRKQKRERMEMNYKDLRELAQNHAIADGLPIDRDADIEMAVQYCHQCHHIVITVSNDLWVNGWLVSACHTPDKIHYVNQHAELNADAIRKMHRRFERMKNC